MKATAITLSAAALIGLLTSLSVPTAFAQSELTFSERSQAANALTQQVNHRHQAKRHGKRHRHHRGLKGLMRGLDLTDGQRDEIFKIRHAAAPTARAEKQAMGQLRRELRKELSAPDYNAARVASLADQIGAQSAMMARSRANTMRQVFEVLTAEQQQQFKTRMEQGPRKGHRRAKQQRPV